MIQIASYISRYDLVSIVWVSFALVISILMFIRRDRFPAHRAIGMVMISQTLLFLVYCWVLYQAMLLYPSLYNFSSQATWLIYTSNIVSFAQNFVLGWALAIILIIPLAILLKRGTLSQLYDANDLALLIVGLGTVGWPNTFILFGVLIVLTVTSMFFLTLIRQKNLTDRISITPYIIPAMVITYWFSSWLQQVTWLSKLTF